MRSGRTSPALCGCEDAAGNFVDDFVVKLRGGMESQAGPLCELLGSLLASHFGLRRPDPALVSIDVDFAELVAGAEPKRAYRMRNSVGLNFGSRILADAAEWPVDKAIPYAMRETAVRIFAFDALIQNPDRRFDNQNLLTHGDDILVFDHEIGFSFLLDILPLTTPWRLDRHQYLTEHVFYRQLKSEPIDLDGFSAALIALPGVALEGILAQVPAEWNNEVVSKIQLHLETVSDHAAEFIEEIKKRLA
ncbi:MAG TPA: HipA family kinase [Bryobacteraceae bacterium]|nr:HipA family kinase [Bryobacteraceae bacterium]